MGTYPKISKKQCYYYLNQFPYQSQKVIKAVKKVLDPLNEKNFDFNALMNYLFWSKDILLKMGYYHFKVQLEKGNLLKY
jgi:hypothetical protein